MPKLASKLIKIIADHSARAYFNPEDHTLSVCEGNRITPGEQWERIECDVEAVRDWLGY